MSKAKVVQIEGEADVDVETHGSIVILQPRTARGGAWLRGNVASEPWQVDGGGALAVAPRYLLAIVDGMEAEGFLVGEAP